MISLREKKGKSKMKKILIIALIHFLFSINLFANEKECKEKYPKWIERMQYNKCVSDFKKTQGELTVKSDSKFKNTGKKISEKYKNIRDKAPKTGVEIWKKFKKE